MGGNVSLIETLEGKHNDGLRYYASFDSKWFSKGESRYAFKGTYKSNQHSRGKCGDPCVVKVFKKEYARNFDEWVPDLAASNKADEFARQWNRDVLPQLPIASKRTIRFKIPFIVRVDESTMTHCFSRKNTYIMPQEYLSVEDFISGEYVKFTSNGGFEDKETSAIMPCFTHWTFENSGRRLMITDLQGVKQDGLDGTRYLLTDPAIHSADQIYGMTDLGVVGMEMIMQYHHCNFLCRALNLTNPVPKSARQNPQNAKKPSTYDFELTSAQKRMNREKKTPHFAPIPE